MAQYFGTDGIRGPIATSPLLTPYFLQRLGVALAEWARTDVHATPTILLASDTRASCPAIARALAAGITYAGAQCVSAGILPTPGLQRLVTDFDEYQYGIMISASHNPATDNGIKLITPTGKLSKGEEFSLSSLLSRTPTLPVIQDDPVITDIPTEHIAHYCTQLIAAFPEKALHGIHIALDCAHGATAPFAAPLFKALGATTSIMSNQPNGYNINDRCGSTNPQALQTFVRKEKADFGFAFDGDGDRVIAVNRYGEICDGDQLLALLATHPDFVDESAVVGTVMTNCALEAWLESNGKHLLRTPVGDAHVLHAMKETNLSLGGEPSGHIIARNYLPSADALYIAMLAAHTAILTENHTLQNFAPYPQIIVNLPVSVKQDLTQEPYASIIRAHTPPSHAGRSIVRYSGTEPVLRIMIEHASYDNACEHATQLAEKLQPLFTS